MNNRNRGNNGNRQDRPLVAYLDIDPLDKQLKIMKTLSIVAGMVFSIIGLCFSVYTRRQIKNANTDLYNVISNWQQRFIFDLEAVPSTQPCSGNKSEVYLSYWPGTGYGCNCLDTSRFMREMYDVTRDLHSGSCSYNKSMAGCKNVMPTPAKPMHVWRGGQKYCATTYKGISFIDIADRFEDDKDCLPGTIKCGKSAESVICLPEWVKECPVSEVRLSRRVLEQEISEQDSSDKAMMESEIENQRRNLQFQQIPMQLIRNTTLPLVEMRIGYQGVCFDNSITRYPDSLSDYKLMSDSRRDFCSDLDKRFKRIDSFEERSLLVANSIPYQTLPLFREKVDTINPLMDLFTRSAIQWNLNCKLHLGTVVDNSAEVASVAKYQDFLLFFTIVNFVLLTIILPTVQLCVLFNTRFDSRGITLPFGILNQESNCRCFLITIISIGWVAKFGQVLLFYLTMKVSERVMDHFHMIAEMNCSDEVTNGTFRQLDTAMRDHAYRHNKNGLIVEIVVIVANLISALREIILEVQLKNRMDAMAVQERERELTSHRGEEIDVL